ncbi:MAG: GlxA family transcriptional regulator [Rhizobiales bacterium]|nr:GlxA family transcriptional regulator [Hyphomicrobiales bacterium]
MSCFGILLARDFTHSAFALFVDTLRLAGDEGDRSRRVSYDWRVLGDAGLPIRSSCGVEVLPTGAISDRHTFDRLVVVGGLLDRGGQLSSRMSAFVVHAANSGIPLVGLCTGSFILAELGLLDGYRCAVSWFHIHAFRERFPHIDSSAEALFMLDRDRATCSGGVGAADLAAHLVTADLGEQPAEKASRILLLDRIRGVRDLQPAEPYAHARSTVVRRALLLMEGNLQTPLGIAQVAQRLGVSPRLLQRQFAADIGISPLRAYQELRLRRAESLARTPGRDIRDIAMDTGFEQPGQLRRTFRRLRGYRLVSTTIDRVDEADR